MALCPLGASWDPVCLLTATPPGKAGCAGVPLFAGISHSRLARDLIFTRGWQNDVAMEYGIEQVERFAGYT